MKYILSKSEILLKSLYIFFSNQDYLNIILPILLGESKLSIRLFDWFITNYCKNKNIWILNENKEINIYLKYKLQLKSYKKDFFDPFSRKKRIKFYLDDLSEKYLITTIGQLNFFKWIIENNLIFYIKNNYNLITNEMNNDILNKKKNN
jgi:phage antirepressor YoqD-like protein